MQLMDLLQILNRKLVIMWHFLGVKNIQSVPRMYKCLHLLIHERVMFPCCCACMINASVVLECFISSTGVRPPRLHVSFVMLSCSAAQKVLKLHIFTSLMNMHAYIKSVYHACKHNRNVGSVSSLFKLCRSLSGWYFCPNPFDIRLSRYAVALAVLSLRSFSYNKCVVSYSVNG